MPKDSTDVIDVLTTDHGEMRDLIGEIKAASDPDRRRDLADTLIAEIMRHAVAEEMYVYPAIEEHVPDGSEKVEDDKREHQEIVEVLKGIEDADADDPSFVRRIARLEELLDHHIADEEGDQFPELRAHIPQATLVELGEKVESAKKLAPTRPHPLAPHSELFHKMVGPGVGMIDRLRDRLTGRNTDAR